MRRSNTGGVVIRDSVSVESSDDEVTSTVPATEAAEEGNDDESDEVFNDHIQVTHSSSKISCISDPNLPLPLSFFTNVSNSAVSYGTQVQCQ